MSNYSIANLEWNNKNSGRNYPIDSDGAVLSDMGFALPQNIIVDAYIVSSMTIQPSPIEVCAVHITEKIITVFFRHFSSDPGSPPLFMATAFLGKKGRRDVIPVHDLISIEVSGWIEFGDYMDSEWPSEDHGLHVFNPGVAVLCPRTYICAGIAPVLSMSALYTQTPKLSGDIKISTSGYLVADPVAFVDSEGVESLGIVLSLSDSSQFLPVCSAGNDAGSCDTYPIRAINGVVPNQNGTIFISMPGGSSHPHMLTGSVLKTSKDLCSRPAVYDSEGELKPGPGVYWDRISDDKKDQNQEGSNPAT